ncbi:hypothetical protein FB645_005610 [Coemansia sp. IMI 203386]|nr:hypothetical protein FB645_005610 [Coemansia sp. IMI 203386]
MAQSVFGVKAGSSRIGVRFASSAKIVSSPAKRATNTSAGPERNGPVADKKDIGNENKESLPAFGSTESKDQDLTGSLFNPAEGYLQGSEWSTSFAGMATQPFESRVSEVLMAPIQESEIEIKPDGLLYLPEIKYRRILNRAFGPGGWGLVPRGAHSVSGRTLSREYALICLGRFISQARGEQDFFDEGGLATATEGCKSNALVRCCKDLGVASELWDPGFITKFKAKYCVEEWVTHAVKGNKKRMWRLKDRQWDYPWTKK